MQKKPLILVTNDDGITAPGIKVLVEQAKDFGEVVVIAPDKPQSGMGHAITVNEPLRLNPLEYFGMGVQDWSCSGTPVDCVKLGIYEVLKRKPDLILSGINHGNNSATNILYSGTMSAAVEGALEGISSIGFSLLDHSFEADFQPGVPYIRNIIENALKNSMPEGVCLNVNIPKAKKGEIKGVRVCRQARAFWEDKFDRRMDPLKREYFWLTGEFKNFDGGEDADIVALGENFVSIVPVQFDMTAHHAMSNLNTWDFEKF